MIEIPTVDDFFQLARRYREFHRPSLWALKDYGVMRCYAEVAKLFPDGGARILEFGHGTNAEMLAHFQDRNEMWAIDRQQGLHYFKSVDWDALLRDLKTAAPKTRFVVGLLGQDDDRDIPDGYFDCIASVSVLEEVTLPVMKTILAAAYRKLRPGGYLIGSHDLRIPIMRQRLQAYLAAQRTAGFYLPELASIKFDWNTALLESPAAIIFWYQSDVPEDVRRFGGHYTTMFTVARKPLAP